jgi:diguanylate cyclase (GGDEF)-like protein/PAS domain S-box-containing protein
VVLLKITATELERSMPIDDKVDFQFLADNSADIIVRSKMDLVLNYVSPSSLAVLGWEPDEMTGKTVLDFIVPEDRPLLAAAIAAGHNTVTLRMRKMDGSTKWMENRASLIRNAVTGESEGWVVTMRDIAERKELEERLSALVLTDDLTGISNRRAFDGALVREWKRTLREGSQISLLLLDIDHFKEFNDQFGHQAGDDCLRAVASAVTGAVRDTDIVARYGGEEIAVILPSTDIAGAVKLAEKVRSDVELLRFPYQRSSDSDGCLTASIGAATALARLGGTMKMPESLLLAADNALYKAKGAGRNCVATALVVAAKGS